MLFSFSIPAVVIATYDTKLVDYMNFSSQPKNPSNDAWSRRNFMKMSGGCAALSSTSVLSQMLNLQMTGSVMAQDGDTSDYKALVCVFFMGGIDSYNVLAPFEDAAHAEYKTTRTNLALEKSDLLEITAGDRTLGIHNGMPEMHDLYSQGKLSFIANVGSLIHPTTKANYNSVQKPLGLFSHSDLQQHWQTAVPQSRSQFTGWGGRIADMLNSDHNANPSVSMNISLSNLNLFQSGSEVIPYVVQPSGATRLNGYTAGYQPGAGGLWRRDAIYTRLSDHVFPSTSDSTLGTVYSDLLSQSYAKTKRISINAALEFNDATSADTTTEFPNTNLGTRLKMIAKTIRARETLGQSRQIFFVTLGGWDMHGEVINAQANLLPQVSQAMKAFYDETVDMGVADKVTTFTASDFARTLSSNGNGSDHAWGGNQFVMGGAVNGGSVFGEYPASLARNNELDLGRGRLIPTMSVDEYNAELAMWFGVPNNESLVDVLPNIRNWYSAGSSSNPIGFLT